MSKDPRSPSEPEYRDPHPGLLSRLYWSLVGFFGLRDVPPVAYVGLYCPEAEVVIATEHTEPAAIDRDVDGCTMVATYDCWYCGGRHSWCWGPPAPIAVDDDDRGDSTDPTDPS